MVVYILDFCQSFLCATQHETQSMMLDHGQLSSIHRHASPVLTKYGHPVCSKQLTAAGVISASQVVQVMIVSICLPVLGQMLVFLTGDHLAFMRDCLDVVLVLMARLVQGMLKRMKRFSVWPINTVHVSSFRINKYQQTQLDF